MATLTQSPPEKTREVIEKAVIRFCGDSGDGMQVTGNQFTNTAALYGNDLVTFPDYPAEIRAPTGTLPGVSGFQVHFGATEVFTPGDAVDVLVAMNPAALKMNLADLKKNGLLKSGKRIVVVNTGGFYEKFREQLEKMNGEGFLKREVMDSVHFADTPEAAMRYIEHNGN